MEDYCVTITIQVYPEKLAKHYQEYYEECNDNDIKALELKEWIEEYLNTEWAEIMYESHSSYVEYTCSLVDEIEKIVEGE